AGKQALPRRGKSHHDDRLHLLRKFLVEENLEVAQRVGGKPPLAAAVVEIERAAVRHQHAHDAALEHAVEVAVLRLWFMLEAGERRRRRHPNERYGGQGEPHVHEALQQAVLRRTMGPRSNTHAPPVSRRCAVLLESKRVLEPIDRVSEIIFGVLMAMTFIGTMNVATAGREEVRTVMLAALGCNVAWGLTDGVMYLVAILTQRTRERMLATSAGRIAESPAPRLNGRDFKGALGVF